MKNVPRTIQIFILLFMSMASTVSVKLASAGDIKEGREKASLCVRCHGHDGIAKNPLLPNLAGQNDKYFIKQMHDFKEKRRRSTPMREITNTLSAEDIENLAAYYQSLKQD